MVGEWVVLGCERIGRGHLRRRVPLVLAGYGLEETKWAKVGGRCSMSPVQCSPEGCGISCTTSKGRDLGEACSSWFWSCENTPLCAYMLYYYCARVTAMTWLHAATENAGYAVVIPRVSCSDRKNRTMLKAPCSKTILSKTPLPLFHYQALPL